MSDGEGTPRDWPRPVVHLELLARDPAVLVPFYEALFHWRVGDGGDLRFFEAGLGGPEPGPGGHFRRHEGGGGVVLYVQVADLDAALAATVELGGTVTSPPFDVVGRTLAGIEDPEGNPLMLVQQ